jgi:hypothetical protein
MLAANEVGFDQQQGANEVLIGKRNEGKGK